MLPPKRYAGLGPSRVRTRIPSTRRLSQWMGVASRNSRLPCAITTLPGSLPLSSPGDRSLAASTSYFFHAAMNLYPPSVSVATHASAFNTVIFQSTVMPNAMPNARMSLRTQSTHSFSFPPRPLRTAPSSFLNTNHFGSRPPLIWMSARALKSLLVRNVVSMLSHRVISRASLIIAEYYQVWINRE